MSVIIFGSLEISKVASSLLRKLVDKIGFNQSEKIQ